MPHHEPFFPQAHLLWAGVDNQGLAVLALTNVVITVDELGIVSIDITPEGDGCLSKPILCPLFVSVEKKVSVIPTPTVDTDGLNKLQSVFERIWTLLHELMDTVHELNENRTPLMAHMATILVEAAPVTELMSESEPVL